MAKQETKSKPERLFKLKALNITLRGRVVRKEQGRTLRERDFPEGICEAYLKSGHIEEVKATPKGSKQGGADTEEPKGTPQEPKGDDTATPKGSKQGGAGGNSGGKN